MSRGRQGLRAGTGTGAVREAGAAGRSRVDRVGAGVDEACWAEPDELRASEAASQNGEWLAELGSEQGVAGRIGGGLGHGWVGLGSGMSSSS